MGRPAHQGMSAKNFKDPLLMVLGQKSGFQPNVRTPFKDTYQDVCKLVGCTEEEYGTQDTSGKLWVHQWIGFAMKACKKDGLTDQSKKGRWELTPQGVEVSRSLCVAHGIAVDEAPNSAAMAQAQMVASVQSPIAGENGTMDLSDDVIVNPGQGVSLAVDLSNPDESEYHPDPYIRSLAIQATRCRGNYSDRSQVCERCAIQGTCKAMMAVELSALAEKLRKRDREEAARIEREAKEAERRKNAPKQEAEAPVPQEKPGAYKGKGERIIAALDSQCGHCGETIKKDETCIWVAGVGTFHEGCVEES